MFLKKKIFKHLKLVLVVLGNRRIILCPRLVRSDPIRSDPIPFVTIQAPDFTFTQNTTDLFSQFNFI